MSNKNIKKLLP